MVRPDLAGTLTRLETYGPWDFYRGRIARAIAAEMKQGKGLISLQDLGAYRAILRQPIMGAYRGYEVVSMPPPSSGGIALIEMLNILQRYPLNKTGAGSAQSIHLVVEAMRRAFADRSRFPADPAFVHVPAETLTSRAYAHLLARTILSDRATPSSQIVPGAGLIKRDTSGGQPAGERQETTHFDVVDARGDAVSCTYTLNGLFGSGVMVPGTGILLNDEMDDFTSSPGHPNMFGLIQGEANAIQPGKRPLSSMTPTFLLKNGRLVLATGSPGGPSIISTVLQVLMDTVDFRMGPAVAEAFPRFHDQWRPDVIRIEPRTFAPATLARLRKMGYTLKIGPFMGDAQTIAVDPRTGQKTGATDPRGSGVALGY
jgi:gamma-glutamyltranspeptidase/glutathione hydrolase